MAPKKNIFSTSTSYAFVQEVRTKSIPARESAVPAVQTSTKKSTAASLKRKRRSAPAHDNPHRPTRQTPGHHVKNHFI